jgi:hypothetical protein
MHRNISRQTITCGLFVALGLGCALSLFLFWKLGHWDVAPEEPALSFAGDSSTLARTVIVPTLDTPFPEGKSAVWCSSFQIAWNHLKSDVAEGPVLLENAEPVANRLNRAEQTEADLNSGSYYAAAGLVKNGIVKRIRDEMTRKFPGVPTNLSELDSDVVAVAYGYLNAQLKFRDPFFQNDESFIFNDSSGGRTSVKAFGIRKKDDYAYVHLREQVAVLYCPEKKIWKGEVDEFVLDPCKYSEPYQLVLARVGRKSTLADTLADVQEKTTATPATGLAAHLHQRDILLIPDMSWRVDHHFNELEGREKQFLNPGLSGLYLASASQVIQFRLNRSGAELASEAKVLVKPGESLFLFNGPFLICMRKRDASQPFFVMWVDNAELLQKFDKP